MSERLLCGSPEFSVALIMDDQAPLNCTGLHFTNPSPNAIFFGCSGFGSWMIAPASESRVNLLSPVAVETVQSALGKRPGWRVAGITDDYYVAHAPQATIATVKAACTNSYPASAIAPVPVVVAQSAAL